LKKTIAITLAALLTGACASAQEAKPTAAAPAKAASAEAQPKCQASPKDLVVKDLETGTGRELIPKASVMVNYTGWLYDGCKPDLKGNMFDT